jgi:hypothetical protein
MKLTYNILFIGENPEKEFIERLLKKLAIKSDIDETLGIPSYIISTNKGLITINFGTHEFLATYDGCISSIDTGNRYNYEKLNTILSEYVRKDMPILLYESNIISTPQNWTFICRHNTDHRIKGVENKHYKQMYGDNTDIVLVSGLCPRDFVELTTFVSFREVPVNTIILAPKISKNEYKYYLTDRPKNADDETLIEILLKFICVEKNICINKTAIISKETENIFFARKCKESPKFKAKYANESITKQCPESEKFKKIKALATIKSVKSLSALYRDFLVEYNARNYTPEIAVSIPKIPEFVPEITVVIPKIPEFVPEIAVVIPKIPEFVPEIAEPKFKDSETITYEYIDDMVIMTTTTIKVFKQA